MKKTLAIFSLGTMAGLTGVASAQTIGYRTVTYARASPVVIQYDQPVFVRTQPVIYQQTVYVAPPPVCVAPRPVYCPPPAVGFSFGHHGGVQVSVAAPFLGFGFNFSSGHGHHRH